MPGKRKKLDTGKVRYSLLPWDALELAARVMQHGLEKYEEGTWKDVPSIEYEDALLRHVVAYMRGEYFDPDSQLPHLAHAVCCGLILLANASPALRPEGQSQSLMHSEQEHSSP